MAQLWNRYTSKSQEFKGGIPVWVEIPKDRVSGGLIMNALQDMEVLASGSPVEYNYKTHAAKILKCFEVEATQTSDLNTIITLKKTAKTPKLYAGMNVMVAPSSISGTGKAVTLGNVDESESGKYKITVVTADIDAVSKGKFIVEAEGAGTGKHMFAQPNNLTKEDTVGGEQNTVGIPRGVKYIYENMIPAMPKIVKDNIELVEWEWFPEEVTE
ncbi:hypothetical protein ACGE0T_14370 [Parabacteroides sp. APC149_11_2_Y6]